MDVNPDEISRNETQENREKLSRPEASSSPPPNCAICLGSCSNKCYTDCCLHQFCFNCLLEWSKIKAECPLCKQPFKSIIYNIKSNNEYEEHVLTHPERQTIDDDVREAEDPYNNFYLPNEPRQRPQRHFQFRTTLTLDHGGELAIQRLLLSHPLTNTIFMPSSINRYSQNPLRSIEFRRAIYQNDWWAAPDMSGRYRECTPQFFRDNPGQLHRISPWVNRELGALMVTYENIYVAQEAIINMLGRKHILSNSFRRTISLYIPSIHLDHFIHEFYHYARSQFDMMGYDSHVRYNFRRPESILSTVPSSESEDSDVRVIDSPNDCIYVAPRTPEVIVIRSDNSDSDVIYQAPTPPPVVVVDSDTGNENEDESKSKSKLPIKLRLKLKKMTKKRKSKKRKSVNCDCSCNSSDSEAETTRAHYRIQGSTSNVSSSSCDSSPSSEDTSSTDSDSSYSPQKNSKVKREPKKHYRKNYTSKRKSNKKRTKHSSTDSDFYAERNYKSQKLNKKYVKHKKLKHSLRNLKTNFKVNYSDNSNSCSVNEINETETPFEKLFKQELQTSIPLDSLENPSEFILNYKSTGNNIRTVADENLSEIDVAGPSSSYIMPSAIVKGNNIWYNNIKNSHSDKETSNSD